MFANSYLERQNKTSLIESPPDSETGIIVVIPCFYEPEIIQTLESLNRCEKTIQKTEVIILINHSESSPREIKDFNRNTRILTEQWISRNFRERISYFAVGPVELKRKWAGAGLARKRGMDEAVLRFNTIGKPNGIIVSLDADTLVEKNYLTEIERYFLKNPKNIGATISFKHQTNGLGTKHLEGILFYEKYLEYYKRAIEFTGYPYSMFTVGSAFAVRAEAYVLRGGMNRRQAGEDFYFLQNLAQIGKIGEIFTTKVYPSARLSDRVPFGTGPILRKWMNGEEDLTQAYNFQAFADLKVFFDLSEKLYRISEIEYLAILNKIPPSVNDFLKQDRFWDELVDLNKNCSSLKTFQTRFFHLFNAFKILKYLNFVHDNFYKKRNLDEQINQLIKN